MASPTISNQKHVIAISFLVVLSCLLSRSSAQISTPCTTSMITSFTPCFNFITGSSGNGASPSSDCCKSFKSILQTSIDCACLVVTANVPIPLPISSTLALSLPRACNGGLPLQCKATGSPLPAPGPVLFAPPPPVIASPHTAPSPSPHSVLNPLSTRASKAVLPVPPAPAPEWATETPSDMSPESIVTEAARSSTKPGIRPVFKPTSVSPNGAHVSSTPLLAIILGLMFHCRVL
ncbi:hypothetical protein MLD38_028075 [Melastoma candidum]|uniref:Uncharacterized protein n=1 Tax=Melastoma candidum TaxID=119954 RepID=A0ACB9N015_9MYRT|nr:hypothetical protein MLD38_028075 [Melastoma candidum]